MIDVKHNLPDFLSRLKTLKLDVQTKVMRAATNAAAQAFKKAVIAGAPQRTGQLKRSVYVTRSRSRSQPGVETYSVGVRGGRKSRKAGQDAYYWYFLERGWVPGKRAPGRRVTALQRARSGARTIRHPFIGPAFARSQGAALAAFSARFERRFRALAK